MPPGGTKAEVLALRDGGLRGRKPSAKLWWRVQRSWHCSSVEKRRPGKTLLLSPAS